MFTLPPLAAENIGNLLNFPLTNSYVTTVLVTLVFVVFALIVNRALKKTQAGLAPRGLVNFVESILETLFGYFDQVTGSRKKTQQFLPIVGSLFLFILVSNWFGLLPGIGSIGFFRSTGHETEFIPLFRGGNADLNMTLAMAVFAVISSHVIGVMTIGFFRYANKFIKLGDVWHAVKSKQPVNILTAIVEFFVGFIEIFSEIAKMISLSLRLFGNVFAGEVLLAVLGSLIAFIVPLPFMALELLVGIIQATVFSMLTLVYLTMATAELPSHETAH